MTSLEFVRVSANVTIRPGHFALLLVSAFAVSACNSRTDVQTDEAKQDVEAGEPEDGSADGAGGPLNRESLYPGAQPGSTADRFVTGEPIDQVLAWYTDSRRRSENMFASAERRDDGYLVLGTAGSRLLPFTILLSPRQDGGTELRLLPGD